MLEGKLEGINQLYRLYITLPLYRLDLVTFKLFLDDLEKILGTSEFTTKGDNE
jgi:hypothetical protein